MQPKEGEKIGGKIRKLFFPGEKLNKKIRAHTHKGRAIRMGHKLFIRLELPRFVGVTHEKWKNVSFSDKNTHTDTPIYRDELFHCLSHTHRHSVGCNGLIVGPSFWGGPANKQNNSHSH